MKLIYRALPIVALLSVLSSDIFAQGPGNGDGGAPCPPWLPCVPITDHIEILFFIMIGFFGLFKAYQYSRKTSVQS